jgi:large subunit ribosomal protein L10
MPTLEKERIVKQASERLENVKGIYLADFTGMTVEAISELRKRCRQEQVEFRVIRNTLLKRALNARGITELDDFLVGPTGIAMSARDEVSPARIMAKFAKDTAKDKDDVRRPRIKAALVEGRLLTDASIQQLAELPSREVLLQQVLGTIIAPMTLFLGAVEATLRLPATMADVLAREREKAPQVESA